MRFRILGRTGIPVSLVAFGAGPVSGWATAVDPQQQLETVREAINSGINWFDTAPTYSDGRSELALGQILTELNSAHRVHVATKVRLTADAFRDVRGFVHRSVEESLRRLKRNEVTLLQLHNSITVQRGDQPTSITVHDVLGPDGVLSALEELCAMGLVKHLGLTGLGDAQSLKHVVDTGRFDTIQAPYNLLNVSAGQDVAAGFAEDNLQNLFWNCSEQRMGVFAIRVFAGGALAFREPSAHTRITKFFPLDLYERDRERAKNLAMQLPEGRSLPRAALQFALAHTAVSSAIVGFGHAEEVRQSIQFIANDEPSTRIE